MKFLNVLSFGPDVKAWLANSHQPRILHVFEHACNLINESGEVLSIVTPHIGNGPFNLVIADTLRFTDHLDAGSAIAIQVVQLQVGPLAINTKGVRLWNPRPNWELLHTKRDEIISQLTYLSVPQFSNSPISTFSSALVKADLPNAKTLASQFAGLGIGLTPSSDDFILGALHAAWIIHPPDVAQSLAREVANIAAPLTTSLSGAWLRAAARGESGILWHEFFDAAISSDDDRINGAVNRIQSIGATSGSDALTGFFDTLISYAEAACPS
jgi:hypothetical protein